MASVIDMSDQNAWDDSVLIDSWDDAVLEYKKYHSIHTSGKRLEDVLTKEELEALRGDHGDLIQDTETTGNTLTSSTAEQGEHPSQPEQSRITDTAGPALENGDQLASIPQALLRSVPDDNLKNIMMSWYYAGYYTGLHVGQQQASKDTTPNQ